MTPPPGGIIFTVLLSLCFAVLLIRVLAVRRSSARTEAILMALGLAAVGSLGAWTRSSAATAASAAGSTVAGCASIGTGLSAKDLRARMGPPESIVSEEAALGPDAEAWLYVERGCVAHLMDARVNWVEYE